MLEILDLLIAQTQNGTLEWSEAFGMSYKTNLADQTIIIDRDYVDPHDSTSAAAFSNSVLTQMQIMGGKKGASLEIRGKTGEAAEKVERPDLLQPAMFSLGGDSPPRYSDNVFKKLEILYKLVANRREALANQAVNDVLKALQKRAR